LSSPRELKVPEEMFKDVKFFAVGDIGAEVRCSGGLPSRRAASREGRGDLWGAFEPPPALPRTPWRPLTAPNGRLPPPPFYRPVRVNGT
uniref:PAX interacting protein 1 n=1 Tax=Podarcis muralis TaxID=64176 RepID=A0A670J6X1_PODMU